MHAVSSGQVFLAHMSSAALDAYLDRPLEATTPHTLVDPEAVRERLRAVLLAGYSWVHDEFAEGISSVASGIADASGEVVAALHVHGPSYRFPPAGRDADVGRLVATTAARIARTLRQTSG
jgi:DNA-binding IclR family transcriptional regulator